MASKKISFTENAARKLVKAARIVERFGTDKISKNLGDTSRIMPQTVFAVRCTVDGGTVGSASTTCSLRYEVNSDSGYKYGTELTPTKCRYSNVVYTSPPSDSWGLATYDKDGIFVLLEVFCEQPEIEDCS